MCPEWSELNHRKWLRDAEKRDGKSLLVSSNVASKLFFFPHRLARRNNQSDKSRHWKRWNYGENFIRSYGNLLIMSKCGLHPTAPQRSRMSHWRMSMISIYPFDLFGSTKYELRWVVNKRGQHPSSHSTGVKWYEHLNRKALQRAGSTSC